MANTGQRHLFICMACLFQRSSVFFLRLSVCPPAGYTSTGTHLPLSELGLFLQQCVSWNKGNNTEEKDGEQQEEGVNYLLAFS